MLKKLQQIKQNSRTKNFFVNTFFNFILIGLKLGINLLIFPLLLSSLKQERFGIWQTILSIVSFIAIFNFGYPNGLRNVITKLLSNNNKKEINSIISVTYIKLIKITFLLMVFILPIIYYLFDPNLLFLETNIDSNEIILSLLIFTFFLLLNNILNLSDFISFGFQKSYLSSLFQIIHLSICFATISITRLYINLNLIHIAFIFGSSQTFSYILYTIYQKFTFNLKFNIASKTHHPEMKKLSFHFFLAHFLALIFLTIDNFVISSQLGADETAKFAVVNKLFFSLITLFSILLIHFWNSVTDAYEKKDFKWILKTIKVLFSIAFLVFCIGLTISFFQENIIRIWLGEINFELESITFYLFSVYVFCHCLNAIFHNLQNGLGVLKPQIITTFLALSLYVLACFLIDIKLYGYNAIIIIKIITLFLSAILNSFILKKII